GAAHVVLDLEPDLAVAEAREVGTPQRHAQEASDRLRQRGVRRSTEDPQLATHLPRLTQHPPRFGWGGRIRTFEYGVQSRAPYRLATPHPIATYPCGACDGGACSGLPAPPLEAGPLGALPPAAATCCL